MKFSVRKTRWARVATPALLIILSACSTATDNTPKPSPLVSFTPQKTLTQLWSSDVGNGAGGTYLKLTPRFWQQQIFTPNENGVITATLASNGQTLWKTKTGSSLTSALAVRQGWVIAGTSDGQVLALQANNGRLVWKSSVGNEILAAPRIAQNRVFVKAIDGTIVALDLSTGRRLWSYKHSTPVLILRGSSRLQVNSGIVVAGFDDGKLGALNASNGQLIWERSVALPRGISDVARMVNINADPIVNRGVIYVATYQGKLAAIRLKTGNLIWDRRISSYTGLTLSAQNIIITNAKSLVLAFNKQTGKLTWKQTQLRARVITAPAVGNGQVLVGDGEGYLHALSLNDGHFVARTLVSKKPIVAPPIIKGQRAYVLTQNGNLYAYAMR